MKKFWSQIVKNGNQSLFDKYFEALTYVLPDPEKEMESFISSDEFKKMDISEKISIINHIVNLGQVSQTHPDKVKKIGKLLRKRSLRANRKASFDVEFLEWVTSGLSRLGQMLPLIGELQTYWRGFPLRRESGCTGELAKRSQASHNRKGRRRRKRRRHRAHVGARHRPYPVCEQDRRSSTPACE